ncbi:MAG: alkaline phosphatase D family protein [Burkholderiaceae bacterium]
MNAGAGLACAALSGCATQVAGMRDASVSGKALTRLAFGSCIDQTKPQPIWQAVQASKPDLFIFGGDNVYASESPWRLENLQRAYQQLDQSAGFAQLRQTVPHLAIWDDHDYGLNDGGAEFPNKQASKDAFLSFWKIDATDPRRTRDGLYHSTVFGPEGQKVQVILLDCRWFRSPLRPTNQRNAPGKERYLPDSDPAKTMLGVVQWQWLEQQLLQPADVRLIVSGVQVVADGHGWECWGNFPAEQARLFDVIRRTQAKGVVFLSGDRHVGAFYRLPRAGSYPLYELTSSGMTHAWPQAKEAGPNRLGELVTQNHFATLDIDWSARRLLMGIKDEQGQTLRQQAIALAELG